MKKYNYYSNCVSYPNLEELHCIVDNLKSITYKTLVKHVDVKEIQSIFPFYFTNKNQGLTLKNDWSVTYHKSKDLNNETVYIICHSAIEYVFKP